MLGIPPDITAMSGHGRVFETTPFATVIPPLPAVTVASEPGGPGGPAGPSQPSAPGAPSAPGHHIRRYESHS